MPAMAESSLSRSSPTTTHGSAAMPRATPSGSELPTTGYDYPPPPSPPSQCSILLFRIGLIFRFLSMINPIMVMAFQLIYFDEFCDMRSTNCTDMWYASIVPAVIALTWDLAVAVSLIRIVRRNRGISYANHASIAAVIAAGAMTGFGIVLAAVIDMVSRSWLARSSAASLMAFLMLSCWNDLIWALFGWRWMRKYKLQQVHELYGLQAGA